MTLIERILTILDERNMSRSTLYRACDISQSRFSTWVVGNVNSIPTEDAVNIAKYLNISCDELLTGKDTSRVKYDENKQRLIDGYDMLDWDGKQILLATMVKECRRVLEQSKRGEC